MHRFEALKQNKFLSRIILLGCFSACIPVILIGSVYYQFAMKSAMEHIVNDAKASLLISKDRVERILQNIELDSYAIASSAIVTGSMYDSGFRENVLGHGEIDDMLDKKKNANDFIVDIVYYNQSTEGVISNQYGYIAEKFYKDNQDLRTAMNWGPSAKWGYLPFAGKQGYLTYVRPLPVVKGNKSLGALLIHADTGEIAKYVDRPTDESVLILGPQQEVLLNTGQPGSLDNRSAAPFVQTIAASEDSAGSFFQEDVLYTYLKTSYDRTYISMIPKSRIISSISWIRSFIVLTVFFFFLLSIALALLTSFNVYKPIRRLITLGRSFHSSHQKSVHDRNEISFIEQCMSHLKQQSDQLTQHAAELKPVLKERFFQQLMEENYVNDKLIRSHHSIHELMSHQSYVVIVVTIGDLHKDRRFSSNDRSIIAFMMKNVMNELLAEADGLQAEILQDSRNRAVAVVFAEEEPGAPALLSKVTDYAQNIVESIQHYIKLSSFVGIGKVYPSFTDLPQSYREALLALQDRSYLESVTVISAEESAGARRQGNYYYPSHLKQMIVMALMNGEYSAAETNLAEYMRALRASASFTVITHGYFSLLYALLESLEQQDLIAYTELVEHDLFGQLKERHTPGEVYDWYVYELIPLFKQIRNRPSNAADAVKQVIQYIHHHIYDDISLAQAAETVRMSPSYLSRLFKKELGVQFLEYVQECKIKEATRLMDESGMTVSDVASKIGYSERNLTRMFQKHLHMTPGQYRAKSR